MQVTLFNICHCVTSFTIFFLFIEKTKKSKKNSKKTVKKKLKKKNDVDKQSDVVCSFFCISMSVEHSM